MTYLDIGGLVCIAGAALLIGGCGPSRTPWTGSERELLVVDEGVEGPRLTLLRPSGERRTLPFEGITGATVIAWGLEGEVLAATDESLAVSMWEEGDDESTHWRTSDGWNDSVVLGTSPDSRYLYYKSSGDIDVPGYMSSVYDWIDGDLIFTYSGCGDATRFFSWWGDGPDAVALGNSCQGLGEVVDYSLTHFTPEQSTLLFTFTPEDLPKIRMSRRSDLIFLEYEDRWQLFDLATHRVVQEAPSENPSTDWTWSADGRAFYRADSDMLVLYDSTGTERWRKDFGIQSGSISASPVGGQLLVMSGDCGGGTCFSVLDEADGITVARDPSSRWVGARWSPNGDALIAGPDLRSQSGGYEWVNLETGEIHELGITCNAARWSPDGEMFICEENCMDGPGQVPAEGEVVESHMRSFDAQGIELADIPCDDYGSWAWWSPDSDLVAVTDIIERGENEEGNRYRLLLFDPRSGAVEFGDEIISFVGWRPGPVHE